MLLGQCVCSGFDFGQCAHGLKVAQPHPNQQGLASRADNSAEANCRHAQQPRSVTEDNHGLRVDPTNQTLQSFFAAKPYCVEVFLLGFFVGFGAD